MAVMPLFMLLLLVPRLCLHLYQPNSADSPECEQATDMLSSLFSFTDTSAEQASEGTNSCLGINIYNTHFGLGHINDNFRGNSFAPVACLIDG